VMRQSARHVGAVSSPRPTEWPAANRSASCAASDGAERLRYLGGGARGDEWLPAHREQEGLSHEVP
jgi:hypothetical protein